MRLRRRAGQSQEDLSNEAPADVQEVQQETHTFEANAFGVNATLSSSGNPVVGKAMAVLILYAIANGSGYLVAQLAARYNLHPAVAIPLVFGAAAAVVLTGLWVFREDDEKEKPVAVRVRGLQLEQRDERPWWQRWRKQPTLTAAAPIARRP